MAYIGRQPAFGDFRKVDVSSWTFNASNVSFPLGEQVGNVNQLVVSLNAILPVIEWSWMLSKITISETILNKSYSIPEVVTNLHSSILYSPAYCIIKPRLVYPQTQ